MTNTNPWFENTGMVPDGVGHDTNIEVEYRDGEIVKWRLLKDNNRPLYWAIFHEERDIIRWRFM